LTAVTRSSERMLGELAQEKFEKPELSAEELQRSGLCATPTHLEMSSDSKLSELPA
jgi:hypothetical protein